MESSSRDPSGRLGLPVTETMSPLFLVAAVLGTGGSRTLVGVRVGLSGSCTTVPSLGTGREGWDRSGTVESLHQQP